MYIKAYETNRKVYRLLKENRSIPAYAKSQLGRASLSIVLNIAEGSAKFSMKDRKNFYITARASAFECSALVSFLFDEGEGPPGLKAELYCSFDEISRILFTMVKNIKSRGPHSIGPS
jgi:four helix bundle protein